MEPGKKQLKACVQRYLSERVTTGRVRVFCVIAGAVWLALLPAVCVSTGELKMRSTYFDETTLMPLASRASLEATLDRRMRALHRMRDLFSKDNELSSSFVLAEGSGCTTWGAIRPRSGTAPLDALALVAIGGGPALSFALAVASFLSEVSWLGKNIVVLSAPSVEAASHWLNAYTAGLDDMQRGGLLRAAVVFQQQIRSMSRAVRIRTRGANAAMPNLDLVELATTALYGIVAVDTCCWTACYDVPDDDKGSYKDRFLGIAHFVCGVLHGQGGVHSFFLEKGIDAVTIGSDFSSKDSSFLRRVGVGVEMVLRSLNTVEHRLHHSFSMYILVTPRKFVSIDEYAWPLMLLLLGTYGVSAIVDMHHVFDRLFSSDGSRIAFAVLAPFTLAFSSLGNHFFAYVLSWLAFASLSFFFVRDFDSTTANAILSLAWGCLHAPLVMFNPPLYVLNGILGGGGWLLLWRLPRVATLSWILYGVLAFLSQGNLRRTSRQPFDDWSFAILASNCLSIHAAAGAVRFVIPCLAARRSYRVIGAG